MADETYTSPGTYTYEVPAAATSIQFDLYGGLGGDGSTSASSRYDVGSGGRSGRVTATIDVADLPETLEVRVGGDGTPGGSGGYNGGGEAFTEGTVTGGAGGGASDIRPVGGANEDRILVAGGGAGGGAVHDSQDDPHDASFGGRSGHPDGQDGPDASAGGDTVSGGGGGTQSSGGEGTGGDTDGGFGHGGDGGSDSSTYGNAASGGGGGGWYGGGGGDEISLGLYSLAAGGGGGSGYAASAVFDVSHTTTTTSERVEITVLQPPADPSISLDRVGLAEADIEISEGSGGGEVDQYRLQRQVDGGGWSTVDTFSGGGTVNTTRSGLSVSTAYRWRVRAENSIGNSAYQYTTTRTTGGPPTEVTASGGSREVSLSWSTTGDVEGIEVLRWDQSSASYQQIAAIDPATSYTDTGLTDGTEYEYQITTVYHDGASEPSEPASATTEFPAPTLEAPAAEAYRQLALEFEREDNNPDGSLRVRRRSAGIDEDAHELAALDPEATEYTDTGDGDGEELLDGQAYEYAIRRVTPDASADSDWQAGVTWLPNPEGLSVEDVDGRHISLSYLDRSNTPLKQRQTDILHRRTPEDDPGAGYPERDAYPPPSSFSRAAASISIPASDSLAEAVSGSGITIMHRGRYDDDLGSWNTLLQWTSEDGRIRIESTGNHESIYMRWIAEGGGGWWTGRGSPDITGRVASHVVTHAEDEAVDYFDGEPQYATSSPALISAFDDSELTVSSSPSNYQELDSLVIMNRAATPEEVQAYDERGVVPIDDAVVVHYDFGAWDGYADDGLVRDRSGHGNHGEINDTPEWREPLIDAVARRTSELLDGQQYTLRGEISTDHASAIDTEVSEGLIGWWPMDDADTDGETALDRGPPENHGEIGGDVITGAEGPTGTAYNFNETGDNGRIQVDEYEVTGTATGLSAACWIRVESLPGDYSYAMHLHPGTTGADIGGSSLWAGLSNDNYLTITIGASEAGGWDAGETDIVPTTGEWYHLCASWDGELSRVYVNGSLELSHSLGTIEDPNSPLWIGSNDNRDDRPLSGRIDDVRLYNRALTEPEIQRLDEWRY